MARDRIQVSAVRGRRLTASAMDSTVHHFLLLFFLHPLFPPFLFSFILYFWVEPFFTPPACPTTIMRYYPNGHSRHNSDSFSFSYSPVYSYKSLACFRNETDSASDSSHVSANVSKRSADGDSPSGNEDTEDNTDDTTTDTDQEEDDTSVEDTADDEKDTR